METEAAGTETTEDDYAGQINDEEFEENFKRLTGLIRKRLRDNFDATIAFTGPEGIGKSVLEAKLAQKVDDGFVMENQMLFQPTVEKLVELAVGLPKYSFIANDEAIRILYKLKWSSREQIELNQFFGLCRKENKAIGMCMPRFYDFNEYFRHWRIGIWIHVFARGYAVVFIKDTNPFAVDPWHMDKNYKVLHSAMEAQRLNYIPIEKACRIFSKLTCYYMIIKFPDWTEEERKTYETLKAENSYKGMFGKKDELTPKQLLKMERIQLERDVFAAEIERLKAKMALKDKIESTKVLSAKLSRNECATKMHVRTTAQRGRIALKTPPFGFSIPQTDKI